jgi:hypothetical protein
MTTLEFILLIIAFLICSFVIIIIFIKVVTDWIEQAENHKKITLIHKK